MALHGTLHSSAVSGFRRRLAAITVAAAALTAGTLTPAMAATGPSMTRRR